VESKGLSFTQIKVDWKNPIQKNLKKYFDDMEEHSKEKILLHCQANMRASTFIFLYRVIKLGTDPIIAETTMNEIWDPKENDTWNKFIIESLKIYNNP